MKWNDIREKIKNPINSVTVLAKKTAHGNTDAPVSHDVRARHKRRIWVIGLVIVVLVVAIVFAAIKLFKKHEIQPVLPVAELKAIGTFLDENPPQPLTDKESNMVEKTLSQPSTLDKSDVQALNSFLNR